jgi:hypothetical protein
MMMMRIEMMVMKHDETNPCSTLFILTGSTGLDLSFATDIFLLERIPDPSLRNQIVSRAHRMGATGPVHVQLLQVKSLEGKDDGDDNVDGRD